MKLVIDFDSFIYRACVATECLVEIQPDIYVQAYSLESGFDYFKNVMDTMLGSANCSEYIICLSDWRNFRKELYPTYKSNRQTKRPIFFEKLTQLVYERFDVVSKPYLEADDLCRSIYEQNPSTSIICSIDKDMETFPCKLFNPNKISEGVRIITKEEAFRNFAKQLIMGDNVDGYSGIKGCGEKTAEKVLDRLKTLDDVIKYYRDNGYTEDDFIATYNQAKILSKDDIGPNALRLYNNEIWEIPKEQQ